jgi:hypothetical protein
VINRKATFAEEMNSPNTDAQFSMGASIDWNVNTKVKGWLEWEQRKEFLLYS